MLRILFCITLILFGPSIVYGVPAFPRLVALEDGTRIFIKGDEKNKWGLTEDGYTVLPKDDGWVYAKKSSSGFAEPTDIKVRNVEDENIKIFLSTQPRNIPVMLQKKSETLSLPSRSESSSSRRIIGERKALVILMAFNDLAFKKDNSDFDRLFNEIDYSEDGAIGSVKDYFLWSSYGLLNFSCDIIGPFTAANDMKYYGKNFGSEGRDKNPYRLFEEALDFALQSVDLTEYDTDNDGYIDNFHIIFAGYGEEAGAKSDAIWSHEMTFPAIEIGNIKIDRYSCAPELRGNSGNGISRIGPHCHEMGHALGAMDYYDVDYENNGSYPGTGDWDIMASGSWNNDGITPPDFNPYVKVFDFGWSQIQELEEGYNDIFPSEECPDQIYQLLTPLKDDYYLIENRQQVSFDAGIPGSGLLIFHIGPEINARKSTNSINSFYPQQCYVVCASSEEPYPTKSSSSYGDTNTAGCPFPGSSNNTDFYDLSIPAALCFNGSESGIHISEIQEQEDGIIKLYNGTPPLPQYIISEDFETSDWINSWLQEDEHWMNSGSNSQSNPFATKVSAEDSPVKHDTKYLYTKYSSSLSNKISVHPIETPVFSLEEGKKYSLNFEYYNSKQIVSSSPNPNKLNLFLKTDKYDLILLISLEDTDHDWQTKEVKIPENIISDSCSIVFQGEGKTAGYICIDNVRLQEMELNNIDELVKCNDELSFEFNPFTLQANEALNVMIYDMTGKIVGNFRMSPYEIRCPDLKKGMYIICTDKGNRHKVKI